MDKRSRANFLICSAGPDGEQFDWLCRAFKDEISVNEWWVLLDICRRRGYKESFKNALEIISEQINTSSNFNYQLLDPVFLNRIIIDSLQTKSIAVFEKLIQAGLDIQHLLRQDKSMYLPLMADCNPTDLKYWLKGIDIKVTEGLIAQASTPEGKAALRQLMEKEKATS